jgi:hypothetical protein
MHRVSLGSILSSLSAVEKTVDAAVEHTYSRKVDMKELAAIVGTHNH